MSARSDVRVLHTARCQRFAVANIPMPAPSYYLVTTVRVGARGPQYLVETREDGSATVWAAYLPRRSPMRACGRRDAILERVTKALPHTRPAGTRPT